MKSKRNLFLLCIITSTLLLTLVGLNNSKKTSVNLFTWKSDELSVGNLIAITFIGGITFGSLFTLNNLLINNSAQEKKISNDNKDTIYDDYDTFEELTSNEKQASNIERPPERDINESQPTISVNYRVVNQDEETFSKFNSKSNLNNDWLDEEKEW